ncbi:MAG TPA: hypothetical protein VIH17_11255 [Candidatus Acidoferrales bacterium]
MEQESPRSGIFGFNTTVRVGDITYHVQTEDHGPHHPFVDTVVYLGGRVLAKRVESYGHLLGTPSFSADHIGRLLEAQHRAVIEAIRAGAIAAALAPPTGIQILLLNPASCLRTAEALFQIEVKGRPAGQSLANVRVEVSLHSAGSPPVQVQGTTNGGGRIDFRLPLPSLSAGRAELRIRAASGTLTDEVRYTVRRKE